MLRLAPLMDGEGLGIWLVPDGQTGAIQLHVSESVYVALEVGGWLFACVAGLLTAWALLP